MEINKLSYRQIFKATSLFGGVQIYNIIISIIRSKFVAVLLGPAGMGITGLLTSTIGLIGGITNLGLGTSAVKEISEANSTGNQNRISVIIITIKRWVWFTGLIGTFITLIFSHFLSQLAFGNKNYTISFVAISITLLTGQLASGQMVILQGLRKLKSLAKVNLIGSSLGLLLIIPLYYFLRNEGIVPAIIGTSIVSLLISWQFSKRVYIDRINLTPKQTFIEGKNMAIMGFMISASGLITITSSYIIRLFISNKGGLADVGYYNAGFAIINTYVGMIFTAMATDYYPRLSAVANHDANCSNTINQQAEISILILAPIIVLFLVFIKWVVIVFYSTKFLAVNQMICWAALGMFFKAAGWAIGMVLIAKGESLIFILSELAANIILLTLNLLGYYYLGLTGLGISFFTGYLFYVLLIYLIVNSKWNFKVDRTLLKIFSIQFVLSVICFLMIFSLTTPWSYIVGSILLIISSFYSLVELDKRIGLRQIILSRINK